MNNNLYMFLLSCSVLLGGCSYSRRVPETAIPVKESTLMIQIEKVEVTVKTLTIDYQVTNTFDEGIWVCYDTWVHGERGTQDTTTRIDNKTVNIKLYFNIPRLGFQNPTAVAKYIRLLPGETFSGRIVDDVPIRDYSREWRAEHKEHRDIVLHRATFEVGYFSPKWNDDFTEISERIKEEPDKSKPVISGPFYYLSADPFFTEEQLNGKLHEVMYIGETTGLTTNEESVEVLITDVNIPCSVVVEDE